MAATYALRCQCAEIKTCTEAELQDALKPCSVCGVVPQARVKLAVEDTYSWVKKDEPKKAAKAPAETPAP